jgi:hypothetical protein
MSGRQKDLYTDTIFQVFSGRQKDLYTDTKFQILSGRQDPLYGHQVPDIVM